MIPTLTMMEGIVANLAPPGADYANARASVAVLHAAGVPILAGTDANDVGRDPRRAFRTARACITSLSCSSMPGSARPKRSAPPLRYPRVTSACRTGAPIEPGKRADLVLIDDDPLADIRATRSIRRIWCGGIERAPAETRK